MLTLPDILVKLFTTKKVKIVNNQCIFVNWNANILHGFRNGCIPILACSKVPIDLMQTHVGIIWSMHQVELFNFWVTTVT